ncbi:hypothetical protein GCM10027404_09850 [Arthrobacter tumbae]|uniref:TetR family transcriptional regulator n=1 Tax=Arthrobacter tumbae TaxID=163874 RepID=UPI001957A64B|nr:TetR family transcriptional regulator [Arthrobacter tumbae]MBM7782267.1 AcrR family transcriptional regulator [Arthrobacter tumbae]
MNDDGVPSLRARRRLDTEREIHRAALELFEEQGIQTTTVQQIADRAGVSSRTFFRYFTRKEHAALPGQHRMLAGVRGFETSAANPAELLRDIEAMAESVMALETSGDYGDHARVMRLLAKEPELLALAAAQDQVLAGELRARIASQVEAKVDSLTVLLLTEVAVAVWRASWARWGELAAGEKAYDPVEVYRETRAELRRVVG